MLLQRRGSASAAAEERQCQCCCGAGTAEVLSHELSHACAQHDRHARMICSRRIGGTVHMFMCMHLSHRDDGDSSHALRDWSAYTRLQRSSTRERTAPSDMSHGLHGHGRPAVSGVCSTSGCIIGLWQHWRARGHGHGGGGEHGRSRSAHATPTSTTVRYCPGMRRPRVDCIGIPLQSSIHSSNIQLHRRRRTQTGRSEAYSSDLPGVAEGPPSLYCNDGRGGKN